MTSRSPKQWVQEAMEVADPDTGFGRPGHELDPEDGGFVRQGATRPRITIARSWAPVLTERQKTASGRRFRQRGARGWGRMMQIMARADMTMDEFVETLSNEELARGQLKDKNGSFSGRPPQWVPREFHRACLKELMRRGATLWRENYVEAIRAMTDIAKGVGAGKRATPAERIRAAQFVIERLEGKVPERVEISVEAPWQAAIAGIVAEVSDEQIGAARQALASAEEDMIIEAEIVEDEPEPAPVRRRQRAGRS